MTQKCHCQFSVLQYIPPFNAVFFKSLLDIPLVLAQISALCHPTVLGGVLSVHLSDILSVNVRILNSLP